MKPTMLNRRQLLAQATTAALSGMVFPEVAFAELVEKIARLVVGFPAGGTTDALARVCTEKLRGRYAPTVLVDNRAGAAGRLALMNVNARDIDGSSAYLTPCSLLFIYPHVYRRLGYDPGEDFIPVCTIARGDFALSVGPMVPEAVKTLGDLIAWFKLNSKQAFFASPAAGATPHFVGDMFARAAGIELAHATYKGDAPAVQDLIGGQVACSINNVGVILPHLKSGRARLLATSGTERSRFTPGVPTFIEAGLKDVSAQEWFGVLLPSKAPSTLVNGLAQVVEDIVQMPDVSKRFGDFAFESIAIKTTEFAALLRAERGRWAAVVKASGFRLDE